MAKAAIENTESRLEPTFEAAEISANALRLFGRSVDIAAAAFAYNHIERCTLKEAETIIKAFAERKVD